MESVIYYFTGTGNSLAVAKMLSSRMGSTLIPIASAVKEEKVEPPCSVVGFVFPLYGMGLPEIVERFIRKLQLRHDAYTFAVVTRGLKISGGPLQQLDAELRSRGSCLNAGFYISMVDNYLYKFTMPSAEERERANIETEDKVDRIYDALQRRVTRVEGALLDVFASIYYPRFIGKTSSMDEGFTATDECISCGLCERVCPVDNIQLHEGRPRWLHRCQQCLACIHLCPSHAIQIRGVPPEHGQFINPLVTPEEIASQKKN